MNNIFIWIFNKTLFPMVILSTTIIKYVMSCSFLVWRFGFIEMFWFDKKNRSWNTWTLWTLYRCFLFSVLINIIGWGEIVYYFFIWVVITMIKFNKFSVNCNCIMYVYVNDFFSKCYTNSNHLNFVKNWHNLIIHYWRLHTISAKQNQYKNILSRCQISAQHCTYYKWTT